MSSALQGKNAPATSAREARTARVVQSASGPAHPLLALQSAIGNQAVVRLLREPPRTPWEAMARSQIDRVHVGSGARIHTDDAAAMAADGLKARAVTVGGDVYFGRGQFAPGTPAGDRLLRHELTHVRQAGAPPAIDPSAGVPVAAEDHPAEADARRAASEGSTASLRLHGPRMAFLAPVAPRPVSRHTAAEIAAMTLADFIDYTKAQADWFVESTLSQADRDALWRLLLLDAEGPYTRTGIGDVATAALRAVAPGDMAPLRAFCRATHDSQETIQIHAATSYPLVRRISLGRTLTALEALVPAPVLKRTVSEGQLALVESTAGLLASIQDYWSQFHPHLSGTFSPSAAGGTGPEFQQLLTLINGGGGPAAWLAPLMPLKTWIRDLHRFPLDMLQQLVANLSDLSGMKPLVLVVETGHDDSSFLQSAFLFRNLVVAPPPSNLVIMIEAPDTLASVTARIPTIASTYGRPDATGTRRISSVILAGHGWERGMQLAGTTTTPQVTAGGAVSYMPSGPSQSLDLVSNLPATQALLDALFHNLDPATARLLFAACLTGATKVPAGTAAADIPAAVAQNESLGRFARGRASAAGLHANTVQSARADVALGAATSLTNAAGAVDLQYPSDPHAFDSIPNQYAATGHEPGGVLRAAVEVGAGNRVTAETLLRQRLGVLPAPNDWYDTVTRIAVEVALLPVAPNAGIDLERTNNLVLASGTIFLGYWGNKFSIAVDSYRNDVNRWPFAPDLYTRVVATGQYTAPSDTAWDMRLMVDQAWLILTGGNAARVAALLGSIAVSPRNVSGILPFLAPARIAPFATALLPSAVAPPHAQIRLALAWFFADPSNAHVRSFLTQQASTGAGRTTFSAPIVAELAQASRDPADLVSGLGLPQTTETTQDSAGHTIVAPAANAQLPGAPGNSVRIDGTPHETTVRLAVVSARQRPDATSAVTHVFRAGEVARAIGTSGAYSALAIGSVLAFAPTAELEAPAPTTRFELGLGGGGGVVLPTSGQAGWYATAYAEGRLAVPVLGIFNPSLRVGFSLVTVPGSGAPGRSTTDTATIVSFLPGFRLAATGGQGFYFSLGAGPTIDIRDGRSAAGAEVGLGGGYRWRLLDVSAGATYDRDPTSQRPNLFRIGPTISLALP